MVQMVMNAVGYHASNASNAGNARSVAQQVRTPMLFQKLVGFAILGSGYVAIVATLVHAIGG
ncbi:hypothetical protein ACFQ3P_40480 [Paraburkholderia sabiae]|jgi:hypothetical protein|uniref:Uncharacterized protein n=1 Tax=Paraburkholderia sabiae TaxID=273251 RepID=A0ABU9QFP7_9BURK|nr:hypothetical protein [Paraburkholderia sabiae]WJZ73673.1 hypothetical protein QEN71_26610 [Paraburkholderia sabiae]CAD6525108.1 hypothetical protein LMG24235_01775 [Paraburkholderia sabiae]CAG9211827.1 conserved hypothetical protein [Paraburkholderia sabiae]